MGLHAGVVAAVLAAAVLHASWNALLKGGQDRLVTVVLLDLTALVLSLLLPLAGRPAPASWWLLGVSVLLHAGYKLLRTVPRAGPIVGFALVTGVAIAAYTVTDGLGVRRSGTDLGYVAWLFVLGGFPIPLYAAAIHRRDLLARMRERLPVGLAAGALSLTAYGLVIWAQRRGALAVVAALRETSVLVAAVIGGVAFGERFGRRRVVAAGFITAGIVLLNLPR